MKILKITAIILLLFNKALGQGPPNNSIPNATNCFDQTNLYTGTTNPNDNSQYSYTSNSFNYGLNPNGVNGPTHFDWVNTTQITITTLLNTASSVKQIWSPFYPNGGSATAGGYGNLNLKNYQDISANQQMTTSQKLKAMDILPEDGWELLKYNFGTLTYPQPAPYFVLYNRYSGKIKYFAAITSDIQGMISNVNNIVVRASLSPIGQYDLFANAQPFTHTLEDFDHITNTNAAVTNAIQGIGGSNQYYWLYAEFVTSYDPCVCRQKGGPADMWFDILQVTESSVQMQSQGFSAPVPNNYTNLNNNGQYATSSKIDDNANLTTGQTIKNGINAVIEGYKTWDEYAKKFKDFFNTETNNGTSTNNFYLTQMVNAMADANGQSSLTFNQKLTNAHQEINSNTSESVGKLSGINPYVEDIASAIPYVGAYIAFINFMQDVGEDKSKVQSNTISLPPPSAYMLDTKIAGTITHQSSLVHSNFSLPGYYVNNDFSATNLGNEQVPYPIYNNPLGVFNIIDVPDFKYKKVNMANAGVDPNDGNVGSSNWEIQDYNGLIAIQNNVGTKYPFDGLFHYRLSGPIKYALNPAANLTVKSIDASFVLEYAGDVPLTMRQNAKIYYTGGACTGNPMCYMVGNTAVNKQIPYYLNMYSETHYFNGNPELTTDNLTSIMNKLSVTGLIPEFKSTNYTAADGSNNASEFIRFRTPYVPLQAAENLNFMLVGSLSSKPKVYLKLFCKFTKNNKPDDEPVTMILTYDITNSMNNSTYDGLGGGGGYFYYHSRDLSQQYIAMDHPTNHNSFSGLNAYGAYNTANYGTPGSMTWNGSSGVTASNGALNIPSNSTYGQSWSANSTAAVSTMDDITIGDHVKLLASTNPPTSLEMMTFKNINIGKDFKIESTRNLYAGYSINIDDQFNIGNGVSPGPLLRANNKILLTNVNSAASINTATLLASNEIHVVTGTSGDVDIKNESQLAAQYSLPSAYAFMNGYQSSYPVDNLAATTSEIYNKCGNMYGFRMIHPIDSTSSSSTDTTMSQTVLLVDPKNNSTDLKEITADKKESNTSSSYLREDDFKMSIYPNPTTGELNLNLFSVNSENLNINLEDVTGKVVYTSVIDVQSGLNYRKFDIKNVANGVYILKVIDNDQVLINSKKIVLQQ